MMSKPQPILAHMPKHIKQRIVKSVDTLTKFSLVQCSKEFEKHVHRSMNPRLKFYSFPDDENCITASLDFDRYYNIITAFDADHITSQKLCDFVFLNETEKETGTENYLDMAVSYALNILKKHELRLVGLGFHFPFSPFPTATMQNSDNIIRRKTFIDKLIQGLESMEGQLHVEQISMDAHYSEDCLLRILPLIRPGTLKTITINRSLSVLYSSNSNFNYTEVAKLDQWKQAERLDAHWLALPLDQWSHFNKVYVHFESLSINYFMEIYETLINREQFRECSIHHDDDIFNERISQQFPESTQTTNGPYNFTITKPYSTFTVVIRIDRRMVILSKNPIC